MQRGSAPPTAPQGDRYRAPQGTVALLLLYLALIIIGWAGVYGVMLGRGITR